MLRALAAFIGERFPLGVTIPMALAVAGGAGVARQEWPLLMRATACTWCFLLGARALDDLEDLELDRKRKPERGLATGRIAAQALRRGGVLAWVAAGLSLTPAGYASVLALGAAIACTIAYYALRARLAPAFKPFFLNVPFVGLVLILPLLGRMASPPVLVLGLFVWLSVVGHDFAHSIESGDGLGPSQLTPRQHAVLGVACYLGASAAATAFSVLSHDLYFGAAVAAMSVWMFWLLQALLREPSPGHSERIYVPGALFFMFPLLSRLAHELAR